MFWRNPTERDLFWKRREDVRWRNVRKTLFCVNRDTDGCEYSRRAWCPPPCISQSVRTTALYKRYLQEDQCVSERQDCRAMIETGVRRVSSLLISRAIDLKMWMFYLSSVSLPDPLQEKSSPKFELCVSKNKNKIIYITCMFPISLHFVPATSTTKYSIYYIMCIPWDKYSL